MKIRKILIAAGLACSVLGMGNLATANEWKEIRIGVEATYPPFEYRNAQGDMEGFDVDVANAICGKLNAKCVWVEQSFDGLIPALQARKFDVIHSSMTATEARAKVINFTDPLYAIPTQLIAKKGSGTLPTAESLKGKRLGVLQGTTQETYAKKVWGKGGVQIVSYQDQSQTYADLRAGRLDAALLEKPNAIAGFLVTPEGRDFEFVGEVLSGDPILTNEIAMGLRKSDVKLKDAINKAINELVTEGTIAEIAGKYFQPGEIGLMQAK